MGKFGLFFSPHELRFTHLQSHKQKRINYSVIQSCKQMCWWHFTRCRENLELLNADFQWCCQQNRTTMHLDKPDNKPNCCLAKPDNKLNRYDASWHAKSTFFQQFDKRPARIVWVGVVVFTAKSCWSVLWRCCGSVLWRCCGTRKSFLDTLKPKWACQCNSKRECSSSGPKSTRASFWQSRDTKNGFFGLIWETRAASSDWIRQTRGASCEPIQEAREASVLGNR